MKTESGQAFHKKDCLSEMLLTRKYRPEDESLVYTCRNNMIMCVAVNNIDADAIAEIDKKTLDSIQIQQCFKCSHLQQ